MEVTDLLPHRYPFLFIDRIVELDAGRRAVAIKNVSHGEPVFEGHFPGLPLFPGVLQIECMAQTAGLCLGGQGQDVVGVLASVSEAKFLRPVRPGDQMRIEATILQMRRGFGRAQARITVEGELVSSAEIMFAMRERSLLAAPPAAR